MLFNSTGFLVLFLPATLILWWSVEGDRARWGVLAGASLVFYAFSDLLFVPFLLASVVINYVAARAIAASTRSARRRAVLAAALAFDLGMLGVVKYADFFLRSADGLASLVGLGGPPAHLGIVVPLGISFYTFCAVSYVVDVHRGTIEPDRELSLVAAFVMMFPHLVAGPIVRFGEVGPQLRRLPARLTSGMATGGLTLITLGLFEKVEVADRIARRIDPMWAAAHNLDMLTAWTAAVGFTLQLYFDFSGYSNVAIGLAALLGIGFPRNFRTPLQAVSISDFWRRWHMSLSRWVRDYVYIPLGGSRRGARRTVLNLLVTMTLVGLWHGAAWTFVVWGLYHGALLAGAAWRRGRAGPGRQLPTWAARGATLALVVVGFVVFRAPDLATAGHVLHAMVGLGRVDPGALSAVVGLKFSAAVLLLLMFTQVAPSSWTVALRVPRNGRTGIVLALILLLVISDLDQPSPYLYFGY
jgi:alginate O-acetyltransferase complex protein AlgI